MEDCDAHEETIAGLRTSLELRDAEIARLQEMVHSVQADRPVVAPQYTQHVHPLWPNSSAFVEHCALMIDAQSLSYDAMISSVLELQRTSMMVSLEQEALLRGNQIEEMESEVFQTIVRELHNTVAQHRTARESYRMLCRHAMEAFAHVNATNSLRSKGTVVVEEDAAWSALCEKWSTCRADGDAPITLEEMSNFDPMFWDCCLEEAQQVMKSVPLLSEDDAVLRDVCAVVDLPELLQAVRSSTSPAEAIELWSRMVVNPLRDAIVGNVSFTQLSNNIYEALETLRP
ncbi:Hypothetical protein, putative [Bodo saltans]|uniref:Uncharacterized protein n=1 Tax=Bodo saltans TaxID=75058 RepID=A0A0S4JQB5_BODSA|nr:Hypothetical protein, putative [Bodo saltans]|eukprot:CUG92445.1 Hypothetical protein, putative [Bodo saltans]